jgi:hypothetical protein
MAIAVLCYPPRTFEVTLPGAARPLGLLRWIDVQHYSRHLGPIRALSVGIKEAKIGDQVFLVITSESVSLRDLVGDRRIKRRLAHDYSLPSLTSNRFLERSGTLRRNIIFVDPQ